MIMQCRGVDDPKPADGAAALAADTAGPARWPQRSQVHALRRRRGLDPRPLRRRAADKAPLSGMTPFPTPRRCPTADIPASTPTSRRSEHQGQGLPGLRRRPHAARGRRRLRPSRPTRSRPSPTSTAVARSSSRSAPTSRTSRSAAPTRSPARSWSIPINGLSCDQPRRRRPRPTRRAARAASSRPGRATSPATGVDQAVSPSLWWSASNWRNRFSIPITFGLPPDACDVLDPRAPTGFYGSELLAEAALQWSPAYCLSKERFKFQHNAMSDAAGWNLMECGGGPAAVVSSRAPAHERRPGRLRADRGDRLRDRLRHRPARQRRASTRDLRLNARLLAKLLTQSYLGSDLGRGHPGIGDNPLVDHTDPEFQQLNPGLAPTTREAAATVLSLSIPSDVDPAAHRLHRPRQGGDGLHRRQARPVGHGGQPGVPGAQAAPVGVAAAGHLRPPDRRATCRQKHPAVYLTQVAAPVTTLRKIAEALLDAWPNVQTRCDFDQPTRSPSSSAASTGSPSAPASCSASSASATPTATGCAARPLETTPGHYVAPTTRRSRPRSALADADEADAAVHAGRRPRPRRRASAYPGTMVVYTAAKTAAPRPARTPPRSRSSSGSPRPRASARARATASCRPATCRSATSGATAKLYASAQEVAAAVAAPAGAGAAQAPSGGTHRAERAADASPAPTCRPDAPRGDAPSAAPDASTPTPAATRPKPSPMPPTAAVSLPHLARRPAPGSGPDRRCSARVVTAAMRFFVRPPRGTAMTVTAPRPQDVQPPVRRPGRGDPTAYARARTPPTTTGVAVVDGVHDGRPRLPLGGRADAVVRRRSRESRDQELLYGQFRTELAGGHRAGRPGRRRPATRSRCSRSRSLGLEQVVVEGTASGDLLAGPGHLRDTVLPGSGRDLGRLRPRRDVRRAVPATSPTSARATRSRWSWRRGSGSSTSSASAAPATRCRSRPPDGAARLTLVTAEGSGRLRRHRPGPGRLRRRRGEEGLPRPAGPARRRYPTSETGAGRRPGRAAAARAVPGAARWR